MVATIGRTLEGNSMKRLRYVIIPGQSVEPGVCYLMAAIPNVIPPEPGQPQIIGQRKLNMNMVPVQLEWVDSETDEVSPINLEDNRPLFVVPPTGKKDG